MKFDLIKHLPVLLSNFLYILEYEIHFRGLHYTWRRCQCQRPCNLLWADTAGSAPENRKLSSQSLFENRKSRWEESDLAVTQLLLGEEKKQSDTWVAVALHVIELRISLVRLCVGFEKTQDGSVGHQRKSWLLKEVKQTNHDACGLGSFSVFPGLFFYIPVENWLDGFMSASNNYNGGLMQWRLFRHFNHRWHAGFLHRAMTQYRLNTSKKVKN